MQQFHQFKSKMQHESHPLQESIARALKIHNKIMGSFLNLFGSAENIYFTPDASWYFRIILQHIRNNFNWNFVTAHYGLEKSSLIRGKE